ncbi:MAG: OmpA family protein [Saprospiraceae bacterium]
MRGKILNSKTGEREDGMVYIGKANKQRYQMTMNANSGEFNYQVRPGEKMKAQVLKDGFISQVVNFEIPKDFALPFYDLTLYLDPIVEGGSISLAPIFFVKSKPDILEVSKPALDGLLTTLRIHKGLHIIIEGHTDNQGPEALKKLSYERAEEVNSTLPSRISPQQVQVEGFGGSKPISDNSSESQRAKNRRVEVKISHIISNSEDDKIVP